MSTEPSTDYTPTTQEVSSNYSYGYRNRNRVTFGAAKEAFDRWNAPRENALAANQKAREFHRPSKWYTDECNDLNCEREHAHCESGMFHLDPYRLVCETCSGGDLDLDFVDDPAPWPCPTIKALEGNQ